MNETKRSQAVMGTIVTIHVLSAGQKVEQAIERAFEWFLQIEEHCTRFNPDSELMQLGRYPGEPVEASAILFEAVRFALDVAEETEGAFDPTVGHRMESRGFNREHRSGKIVEGSGGAEDATWRDVLLDTEAQSITLRRPLTLDLGAVAKGMAIDTAVRELEPFHDFAIDAGGDLYLGGRDPKGNAWPVGIRHPRIDRTLIDTVQVSNQAVCTSGDYERPGHIMDPRSNTPASTTAASATVIAPGAMLADALATAAFVLGPEKGIDLLDRLGVQGLIFTANLDRCETRGFPHAA